ncbi:MAG: hypothetical protein SFZ24_04900 [Planctomycetota bacterium]|nr:hypothetical protein [Planctomycetota bacterium]
MVAIYSPIPASVACEITECALTREQLVLEIQGYNPSATLEYLGRFTTRALHRYLEHLQAASEPRGRMARWLRPGDTPAIMGFCASDE